MKKLFLLFILLSSFFGQAQYTAIPDVNFEQALIDLGIDSGSIDGKVLTASVDNLKSLEVPSKNISNLTGIQAFVKLERLNIGSAGLTNLNKISSLDLSKNTNLTDLNCQRNNLSSLDTSANTALIILFCDYNQLTNLDISKNTALEKISCSVNQLTSLDVSKNMVLKQLFCGNNQLTSLDVSKNTALESFACNNNQLPNLDVSKNIALKGLSCGNNQLTSLDVSKNTALENFGCNNNQLPNLDVSKNTALETFDCSNNPFINLDVSKNTALETFYCNNNQLTNLDVSKNVALKRFFCSNNQLTSLDVSKNTVLWNFECSYNPFTYLDVSKNTLLFYFKCNNTQLTNLNLKNGNNKTIIPISLSLTSNLRLGCIQVDDAAYSNANWSSRKDAAASYSEDCGYKITAPIITPPVITATGNQTYCPSTSIKIVTGVTITHDPSETGTDAIYIQISSGYVSGQDLLALANPLLHPTITTSWSSLEGKLKLYSPTGIPVTYSDFEAAIKDVTFTNSSISPSGTRDFSINLGFGTANYLPSNGHFYEYVPSLGINWTKARDEAAAKTYYGLQGYLATLTAADETQLAGAQAPGTGWIGGSDAATEGTWKWVTGPEAGTTFWIGKGNGATTPPFNYANWNTSGNEPNDSNNNEDYAHITAPALNRIGTWNDLRETGDPITNPNYYPQGYIVEYGGMLGDPVLQISASTKITIPKITSTSPSSRCDSGSITLQATASDGIVNWYTNSTGGIPIATGNSFTITNLATTTNYYVDATNGSCPSIPRTAITATINTTPTITSTTPTSRCDTGTVTLGATASGGTINWYAVPTGGTALGTGTSFTSPILVSTTTYYVDATASGCTSTTRTAIIATINTSPTITSTTPASRCNSGAVTLGAVASAGTINWYNVPTGGTSLGTGTSFATPNLASTTTYYVDATTSGCSSPTRTAIIATINIPPTITSTAPASRCDTGTVTLGATASNGTINWYDVPTGGITLGTGTLFTTPILTTTTTYYVDATTSGCTALTRTAITATVNISPSITSTSPASRCDTGTVTIGATASAGTINWYDAATGGTALGIGTTFTTPTITSTTTYYVDATTSGCTSPRSAVVATIYPVTSINEEVVLCQSETATLDASIPGMNYLWSPGGETTQTIVVSSIGDYNVTISSPLANCDSKKNFKVIEHPKPIIKEIVVDENSITIQLDNPENYYEFSIDGELFTDSNQFSHIPSGQHTAYVREKNGCNLLDQDFTIFTISKYFTPNNDGFNDLWEIKEMKNFPNSRVEIFNRYGKLLKQLNYRNSGWNGTFNGLELPADDYWYVLKMEDSKPEIKGHFSLKR